MSWDVWDTPGGVQVVPADDLIVHEMGTHCFCNPEVENVQRTQNSNLYTRKLVVHNAMDGREEDGSTS